VLFVPLNSSICGMCINNLLRQQLEEQSVKHKAELELTIRQAGELKGNEIQQLQLSHEEKEKELVRKLQSVRNTTIFQSLLRSSF